MHMYIELMGYIVEPPEFTMGMDGEYSYERNTPTNYESMLINSDTVTVISPADGGDYALIFLTDGLVIGSQESYQIIKDVFQADYMVIRTSDN